MLITTEKKREPKVYFSWWKKDSRFKIHSHVYSENNRIKNEKLLDCNRNEFSNTTIIFVVW